MMFFKRYRWWALLPLPLAVICLHAFGPDGWREPLVRVLDLSWAAVALAATHIGTKALHDYASGQQAWSEAMKGNVAAAIAFLGRCLLGGLIFFALVGYSRADEVPKNAHALLPVAKAQIEQAWPEMPFPSYLGSLVEKETCITPTHRFCWSPSARLKTSREEGAGLGQLTRAWTQTGELRFDALAEVKGLDPQGLRELSWDSVYTRADLGLRAAVVKSRDCDVRLRKQTSVDARNRMAFCDAAYNGGFGAMMSERKLCALTPGCDPNEWFGHVENHSNKSRVKWQGYGDSAFDINRKHVRETVIVRRPKYVPHLGGPL